MITFEEAYAKAKKLKPEIDKCIEFDNAYMFCFSGDEFTDGPSPVVVLKQDGHAVVYIYYLFEVGKGAKIREFKL